MSETGRGPAKPETPRWTKGPTLPRRFFARPSLQVAPELLGCVVRRGAVAIRLTEVEAYAGSHDPGSHAFRGRTRRNAVMFGPPGHAYLYFTYGMHTCANLVCGAEGDASAVLLRSGEVVHGLEEARTRRAAVRRARPVGDRDLARGPACLVQALGLSLSDNGIDVCGATSLLSVHRPEPPAGMQVRTGPRVGLRGPGGDGTAYPWRFWLDGEPTVSTYRPATERKRNGRHGTR